MELRLEHQQEREGYIQTWVRVRIYFILSELIPLANLFLLEVLYGA
jgi:hypothetical protein